MVFPLSFGSYSAATPTPADSTALIQVACVGDPDPGQDGYTISIDGGNSGSPGSRYMLSGGNQLSYNLYLDAAFSTVWGDGVSGGSTVSQPLPGAMGMGMGMGMGNAFGVGMGMGMGMGTPSFNADHTVYGRTPVGQDAVPGSYGDAPIVTIEF
jgi:spore coat protein U-like protein